MVPESMIGMSKVECVASPFQFARKIAIVAPYGRESRLAHDKLLSVTCRFASHFLTSLWNFPCSVKLMDSVLLVSCPKSGVSLACCSIAATSSHWFVFANESDANKAPAWTAFRNRKILILIDPRVSDPERSRQEVRAHDLGCTRMRRSSLVSMLGHFIVLESKSSRYEIG